MRPNKLRELLKADKPTVATHIHTTWPSVIEAIGHTGLYDYVEFVGEYGPYDLHDLDNMCRAADLYTMSMMLKVDQEPRGFLAQRAIGSGFHSILFADCRSAADVRECVRCQVRPETPDDRGTYGVATRRFTYMGYGGGKEYVQALRDVVVAIMMRNRARSTTGHGRLGVNIVCGWNEDEFQMFGVTKKEHDARYAQGEEWWSIVKRIWAGEDRFDHDGVYYQLRSVEGAPPPFGDGDPLMMNAGSSEAGRGFAIRHSDLHFDAVETAEASTPRIAETKRLARERGREIQVWTPVGIVCRPTQREADDYLQYVVEHADWGAIGYLADLHAREGRPPADPQRLVHSAHNPLARRALARGSYCVVGDPDAIAREFARLRTAGLDGLAINFVDYLRELPYFAAEVLPRLEKLGLRSGRRSPGRG